MNSFTPLEHQSAITINTSIDALIDTVLMTVAESSARIYNQTYQTWIDWCNQKGVVPIDVNAGTATKFLADQPVTLATRRRMMSALRKLAQVLALDYTNPQRRAAYESLKMVKVPKVKLGGQERERQALSAGEVDRVLLLYQGDKIAHVRNRAILAFMFATGVRRSELVALEWRDIDLAEGTAHIRYAKRGKHRDIAVLDFALYALYEWQAILPAGRKYVFCPSDKHNNIGADKPVSTDTVYALTQRVQAVTGIRFTPHLARHTFATESISQGTPVPEVQAQLGHERAETTMRYSHAADARTRRSKIRTRYGH